MVALLSCLASPASTRLDPACGGALADVAAEVELPPGVSADPRSHEQIRAAAATWELPAGVTFTVAPPTLAGDRATVRGELANTTAAPRTVILSEAGAGYFHATRVGEGLVRKPVPPPDPAQASRPHLFPEPWAFTLAPGARWTFETSVVLSCWEEAPGPVKLHWWFSIHGDGQDGEITAAR